MYQKYSSRSLWLLVFCICLLHLQIVSAPAVEVSTIDPRTTPGNETVYPSSTLTSFSATNSEHITTKANETATSLYAETTSSVSEAPSTTWMSINESTSETTTTLETSSSTGTTSATGTTSTIGTASTTQCTTTTTKRPKKDCVIDDANFLNQLRKELINDEGYKTKIYKDSKGNPTFRIGHKITPDDPEYNYSLGTNISKKRIEKAFKADVKAAIESCCQLFKDFQNLPKEVQLIILNMRFNLGHEGLAKFRKFREAVNNGDWDKAADEMVDSKWYKQVPKRAKRLVERMRKVKTKC